MATLESNKKIFFSIIGLNGLWPFRWDRVRRKWVFLNLAIFWPTLPHQNGHNPQRNGRRRIILYIFEIPEQWEIRIASQISIWNIAKKSRIFEFGAKKFAYFKISKKYRIKVALSQRNNFCTETFRSGHGKKWKTMKNRQTAKFWKRPSVGGINVNFRQN